MERVRGTSPRREPILGLLFALLALAASAAEGTTPSPRGLLRMAERPPFAPGQVVHLSWDPLPPEVEEFEILILAEFPAPLRVRLTESEEASLRGLAVTIPALAPCSARFLLRAGSPRGEFLFAESGTWRLASPAGGGIQRVEERQGELWVGTSPARRTGLAPWGPPQVRGTVPPPPIALAFRPPLLSAGSPEAPFQASAPAVKAPVRSLPSPARPREFPLRI